MASGFIVPDQWLAGLEQGYSESWRAEPRANPAEAEALGGPLGDDLWLGFALSTPYRASSIPGPYGAVHPDGSELSLSIRSLQPNLSWRINDHWSLGAGLEIQHGEARPGYQPSRLPADDWEIYTREMTLAGTESWQTGFNIGMRFSLSEQTQLGWQYRSAVTHRFRGDALALRSDSMGEGSHDAAGGIDLRLPAMTSLEFSHQADPRWTLLGKYTLFAWSRGDEVFYQEDDGSSVMTDSDHRHNWTLSLGSEYQYDLQWTLRGGVQYSQTPSLRTMGENTRLALGAGYRGNDRFSVEMAYTHALIRQQSLSMDRSYHDGSGVSSLFGIDDDNPSNVHVFGLGLRYAF